MTALPHVVTVLVLYYGGLLVQTGAMSGGNLVSFILFLSKLPDSFNSHARVYTSLSRSINGFDKAFELLSREPRITPPNRVEEKRVRDSVSQFKKRLGGIECTRVAEQRVKGLHPESCVGEITLKGVKMSYPSRPQRVVLDGLDLTIPSGSISAFIGPSGSG